MALIQCRECGNQISKSAKACPSCGAQNKTGTSCLTWVALAVFVFVVMSIIGNDISDSVSAEGKNPTNASIRKSMVALSITNKDSFGWPSATIYVNGILGGYQYEYNRSIGSGENVELRLIEFTKRNGERFQPLRTDVKEVIVAVPGYDSHIYKF